MRKPRDAGLLVSRVGLEPTTIGLKVPRGHIGRSPAVRGHTAEPSRLQVFLLPQRVHGGTPGATVCVPLPMSHCHFTATAGAWAAPQRPSYNSHLGRGHLDAARTKHAIRPDTSRPGC